MSREVTAAQLKDWMDRGVVTLIDVRGPDEHYARRIPGARLGPLATLTPGDLPEGRVVVHCRSGVRGGQAAERMARSGREVFNLVGGVRAWQNAGYDVTVDRLISMPIMRQVQMIAGGLVLFGVVLGLTVSSWFLALSGFVGAGLFFAGASGFCGMATVLGRMPWNRPLGRGASERVAPA